MALPTTIERLNAHLIGFVRAYTFQLARGIEPQLPHAGEGVDVVGHQAALHAARAIVRTARDKLDVRRMLSAMDSYLAGMGRDISEPFQRLIEELGDKRHQAVTSQAEPPAAEPAEAAAVTPAAVVTLDAGSRADGVVGNGLVPTPAEPAAVVVETAAVAETAPEPTTTVAVETEATTVSAPAVDTAGEAASGDARAATDAANPEAEASSSSHEDPPAASENSTDVNG